MLSSLSFIWIIFLCWLPYAGLRRILESPSHFPHSSETSLCMLISYLKLIGKLSWSLVRSKLIVSERVLLISGYFLADLNSSLWSFNIAFPLENELSSFLKYWFSTFPYLCTRARDKERSSRETRGREKVQRSKQRKSATHDSPSPRGKRRLSKEKSRDKRKRKNSSPSERLDELIIAFFLSIKPLLLCETILVKLLFKKKTNS